MRAIRRALRVCCGCNPIRSEVSSGEQGDLHPFSVRHGSGPSGMLGIFARRRCLLIVRRLWQTGGLLLVMRSGQRSGRRPISRGGR